MLGLNFYKHSSFSLCIEIRFVSEDVDFQRNMIFAEKFVIVIRLSARLICLINFQCQCEGESNIPIKTFSKLFISCAFPLLFIPMKSMLEYERHTLLIICLKLSIANVFVGHTIK